MPAFSSRAAGILAVLASAAVPIDARAEEEVRIAIAAGKTEIRIEAHDLLLFDAETGDPLVARAIPGKSQLTLHLDGGRVRARSDDPAVRAAKEVLVEASSGVRVEGRLFLGKVIVRPDPTGRRLMAINRLPLETYLLGIVGSEMSPAWPMEALKAQAVAARTYAMFRRMMMRAANQPYDLDSSVLSQVYLGAERIRPSVVEAVAATRGEVLAFEHRLVEALFHSTCGGNTVSSRQVFGRAVPYLVPRSCGFCNDSGSYRWTLKLPLRELSARLTQAHLVSSRLDRFERSAAEAPVAVKSGKKNRTLSPKAVRAALGYSVLQSERFTAKTKGNEVIFQGQGFGHGVGLCQWGARGLAVRGKDYRDILEHYYRGAAVKQIY